MINCFITCLEPFQRIALFEYLYVAYWKMGWQDCRNPFLCEMPKDPFRYRHSAWWGKDLDLWNEWYYWNIALDTEIATFLWQWIQISINTVLSRDFSDWRVPCITVLSWFFVQTKNIHKNITYLAYYKVND